MKSPIGEIGCGMGIRWWVGVFSIVIDDNSFLDCKSGDGKCPIGVTDEELDSAPNKKSFSIKNLRFLAVKRHTE